MAKPTAHVLPYTVPKRLGLDKHGLVKDGVLDGEAYPIDLPSGDVSVLAGRTTWSDGASGFRPYALLSGGFIGSAPVGSYGSWLYSDDNYSWIVKLTLDHLWSQQKIKLTLDLVNVFGVLGKTTTVTGRTLADLTWQPVAQLGNPIEIYKAPSTFRPQVIRTTFNKYGSIAYVNIYGSSNSRPTGATWPIDQLNSGTDPTLWFHTTVKISISGNGDIAANGAGITASLDIDLQGPEGVFTWQPLGGDAEFDLLWGRTISYIGTVSDHRFWLQTLLESGEEGRLEGYDATISMGGVAIDYSTRAFYGADSSDDWQTVNGVPVSMSFNPGCGPVCGDNGNINAALSIEADGSKLYCVAASGGQYTVNDSKTDPYWLTHNPVTGQWSLGEKHCFV